MRRMNLVDPMQFAASQVCRNDWHEPAWTLHWYAAYIYEPLPRPPFLRSGRSGHSHRPDQLLSCTGRLQKLASSALHRRGFRLASCAWFAFFIYFSLSCASSPVDARLCRAPSTRRQYVRREQHGVRLCWSPSTAIDREESGCRKTTLSLFLRHHLPHGNF